MCKERFVQNFVYFLAVLVFLTYLLPILSSSEGVTLDQNALFAIDIPNFTMGRYLDLKVTSLVGLHQIDTGVTIGADSQSELRDLQCSDDWIDCDELKILRICCYAALGLSIVSMILSCLEFYRLFGFTAFLLIVGVMGTVLMSTKITSDVAHKIHTEVDALSFVCESSGMATGECVATYAKKMIVDRSRHSVPKPTGWKFELSESGVAIYISGLLISLCISSAFVVISGVCLTIWLFFKALCCCCCFCNRQNGEYEEFLNQPGATNQPINQV